MEQGSLLVATVAVFEAAISESAESRLKHCKESNQHQHSISTDEQHHHSRRAGVGWHLLRVVLGRIGTPSPRCRRGAHVHHKVFRDLLVAEHHCGCVAIPPATRPCSRCIVEEHSGPIVLQEALVDVELDRLLLEVNVLSPTKVSECKQM